MRFAAGLRDARRRRCAVRPPRSGSPGATAEARDPRPNPKEIQLQELSFKTIFHEPPAAAGGRDETLGTNARSVCD
jgi:hypothetical protein